MPFKKSIKTKKLLGYGEGNGKDYKPAFDPAEIKGSSGNTPRFWDPIQERDVLILSSIEHFFYLYFSFHPSVFQIKEQKSIPLEESRSIARDLGIHHPKYKGEYQLVTTDLLVETRDGTIAVAVKPAKELNNKNTLEKLEIEQFFWTRMGIKWHIATDLSVDKIMYSNFRLLFPLRRKKISSIEFSHTELDAISYFFKKLDDWQEQKAFICYSSVDQEFALANGTFYNLLLVFISNKVVRCCLLENLNDTHNKKIKSFNFLFDGFKN